MSVSHLKAVTAYDLPPRMFKLNRDDRGYPIPYFATILRGKPDFTVVDQAKKATAGKRDLCGICGEILGYYRCVIGGPNVRSSRLVYDIPMHEDCCRAALALCPFLAMPSFGYLKRDELPEHTVQEGEGYKPEILYLLTTRKTKLITVGNRFSPYGLKTMFKCDAWTSVEIITFAEEK